MEWPVPVRSIGKSYRNVTGIVSSNKSLGKGRYESTLEKHLYLQLDFAEWVERFEVQPLKVPWMTKSGEFREYTPDVLIQYRDDIGPYKNWPPRLVEVKYRSDLKENWNELKPKFKGAIRYARQKGWDFKILTEVEIKTVFWKNAKFLDLNKRNDIPYEVYQRFIDAMESLKKTTPNELLEYLGVRYLDRGAALAHMWHMIANLHIAIDLNEPMSMNSPIWLVQSVEDIFHEQNQFKPYPW